MSLTALALVVSAAFAHAGWNFYAKRAGASGAAFAWLYAGVGSVLYAPVGIAVAVLGATRLDSTAWLVMLGSIVLHTVYVVLLQRGYATGDLSVVYPVSRGLGPLLAVIGAILVLGERPSGVALVGGLVVCVGVVGLGYASRPTPALGADGVVPVRALSYAVGTGVMIASYTLWDAYAMSTLALSPILFNWIGNIGRWALLTPNALRQREVVAGVWAEHRRAVVVVAVLSPLSYILALSAYAIAPVAYVAPARELSIVVATVLGLRLLAEGRPLSRLAFAATVLTGVVLLSVG